MDIHSDLDHDHAQFHYPPDTSGSAEVAKDVGIDSMQKQVKEDTLGSDPEGENLTYARTGVDNAYPRSPEIGAVDGESTPTECIFEGEWINYFRDKAEAS